VHIRAKKDSLTPFSVCDNSHALEALVGEQSKILSSRYSNIIGEQSRILSQRSFIKDQILQQNDGIQAARTGRGSGGKGLKTASKPLTTITQQ